MRRLLIHLLLATPAAAYLRSLPPLTPSRLASRHEIAAMTSSSSPPYKDALSLHQSLVQCAEEDSSLGRAIKQAMQVLTDALRLYPPECIVSSFNGGKDAVAILHLMRAAIAAHNKKMGTTLQVSVIFFEVADEFPEVEAFLRSSVADYDLKLISYSGVSFADGLAKCIDTHGSKAFVLGTRTGDPNAGGQSAFTPSSTWMPPFMRVNPILHWTYGEVWAFLRSYGLPFCSLYNYGYTSLGKVSTTRPNPALRMLDGSYRPAWELVDPTLERAGRGAADAESSQALASPKESVISAVTAAILIVGDELLKGKVPDTNTYCAAKMLQETFPSHGEPPLLPYPTSPFIEQSPQIVLTLSGPGDQPYAGGGSA